MNEWKNEVKTRSRCYEGELWCDKHASAVWPWRESVKLEEGVEKVVGESSWSWCRQLFLQMAKRNEIRRGECARESIRIMTVDENQRKNKKECRFPLQSLQFTYVVFDARFFFFLNEVKVKFPRGVVCEWRRVQMISQQQSHRPSVI